MFTTPVAARTLSPRVALRWLVRMRWHAVGGQLVALAVAGSVLRIPLPLGRLFALVGAVAASNALLARRLQRDAPVALSLAGVVVLGDTLALTALLALAGGAANPFATLYVAHATLAAFLLDARWTALVVLTIALGHGALTVLAAPVAPLPDGALVALSTASRLGPWVAVVLTALIVAVVVRRLAQAVRERQEALLRAERSAARAATLASLGTLAAGAAHELNTPLGTIALAASELTSRLHLDPAQAEEDAALIGDQIDRCRAILGRMTACAGEQLAEPPSLTPLVALVDEALASLAPSERRRVDWTPPPGEGPLAHVARPGAVQALAHLLGNALDATRASGGRVTVSLSLDARSFCLGVADDGPGIDPSLRERLGDPFLTTKPPGQGMGLGLFLCQAFADRWRGRLSFAFPAAGGTTARLELPRHPESP